MDKEMSNKILLLDEILNQSFSEDIDLHTMIIHSRHINNDEMIEVIRRLVREGDKDGAKRLIMSL